MINKILDARENRYNNIVNIINKYNYPVVCGKINYPGNMKNTVESDMVFDELENLLIREFEKNIVYSQKLEGFDGNSLLLVVNINYLKAKEISIKIEENHTLGRIFDIDIYIENGEPVSRDVINKEKRKCIVCNNDARVCIKERKHETREIISITNNLINSYFDKKFCNHIKQIALKSILFEVSASPKPGLVDRYNNGAHKDMNFFTFIESSVVIQDTFYKCAKLGIESNEKNIDKILDYARPIGMDSENNMLKATKGINTHKGIIFSIGLIAVAAGIIYAQNREFSINSIEICIKISEIAKGITKRELQEKQCNKTYGEKLYKKYKVKGIRGEVESGFLTVRKHGLPLFRKLSERKICLNDILVQVLLNLMMHSEDTNVIGRHDLDTLNYVKNRAQKALELGGMLTEEGKKEIHKMDKDFIERNISPGGAADLLAVTTLLYFLEEY